MLTRWLVVLSLWTFVHIATTLSDIRLTLADENDKHQNNWQIKQLDRKKNHENLRSQLIKSLDLLKKDKINLKSVDINNCLYKRSGLRNRLKCVKELITKTKLKRQGFDKYDKIDKYDNFNPYYTNKYSNEYDYYDFKDLTKSDLGRSYRSQHNFSQDYLDVKDLLRTNDNINKKRYVLKLVPNNNKYNRFAYDLTKFRKFNNNDYRKRDIEDTNYDSSDSSESSEEANTRIKTKKIVKTYTDNDSDESSSSDEQPMQNSKWKSKPLVFYMQGPSRLYGAESRRRLPHFLPKRYHWDEDEMKDLRNYWFNGPQGKYWGHYRTPY